MEGLPEGPVRRRGVIRMHHLVRAVVGRHVEREQLAERQRLVALRDGGEDRWLESWQHRLDATLAFALPEHPARLRLALLVGRRIERNDPIIADGTPFDLYAAHRPAVAVDDGHDDRRRQQRSDLSDLGVAVGHLQPRGHHRPRTVGARQDDADSNAIAAATRFETMRMGDPVKAEQRRFVRRPTRAPARRFRAKPRRRPRRQERDCASGSPVTRALTSHMRGTLLRNPRGSPRRERRYLRWERRRAAVRPRRERRGAVAVRGERAAGSSKTAKNGHRGTSRVGGRRAGGGYDCGDRGARTG